MHVVEAARQGNLALVKAALERCPDVDARCRWNRSTALIAAARRGHHEILEYLVSRGAKLNLRNAYGNTAVDDANMGQQKKIVDFLQGIGGQPSRMLGSGRIEMMMLRICLCLFWTLHVFFVSHALFVYAVMAVWSLWWRQATAKHPPVILFIHFSKCMGSSLITWLGQQGFTFAHYAINGNPSFLGMLVHNFTRRRDFSSWLRRQNFDVVCTEFHCNPNLLRGHQKQVPLVMACWREPFDRWLSQWAYAHLQKIPLERMLSPRKITLVDSYWIKVQQLYCFEWVGFSSRNHMDNLYVRTLLDLGNTVSVTAAHCEEAKEIARSNIDLHLIQEDPRTWQNLHYLSTTGAISLPKVNQREKKSTSPERPAFEITPDIRAGFDKVNRFDRELYTEVCRIANQTLDSPVVTRCAARPKQRTRNDLGWCDIVVESVRLCFLRCCYPYDARPILLNAITGIVINFSIGLVCYPLNFALRSQ